MSSPPPNLRCSFCGKHQGEVGRLIAGPSVYICDQCVGMCSELIDRDLPPRVSMPAGAPWARRDRILADVRRAIEAAFPDRAETLLRDIEGLIPQGGPLVCLDCRERGTSIPDPCPDDFVCADWRAETWTARGYQRAEGIPVAWPWLQVLERRHAAPPSIEYVVLAPLLLRRPVQLTANAATMPPSSP